MGPDEWDGLPWWVARSYLEGLEDEGILKSGDDDGTGQQQQAPHQAPPPQRGGKGVTVTDQSYDLSDYTPPIGGFQTRRVG